jgi:hypothetical protein
LHWEAIWRLFRKEKFDSVHSITPKATTLDARSEACGRALAISYFHRTGVGSADGTSQSFFNVPRLAARELRYTVLADSPSQRLFLIENRIVRADEIAVLADGSISGVNVKRFDFNSNAPGNQAGISNP